MTDNKLHAARRQQFAGAFSKQNLREWEGTIWVEVAPEMIRGEAFGYPDYDLQMLEYGQLNPPQIKDME